MRAEFDYELTRAEFVAGLTLLMEQLRRRDTDRSRRLWEQIVVVVAIILIVMTFFPEGVFALLVAALLISVAQTAFTWRSARGAIGISYDPQVAQVHIEIDDGGIAERSASRERRWSWDAIRQVHETDALVLFELVGWDMLVFPTRLWAGKGERTAFVESLPASVARAEPPRANQEISFQRGFHDTIPIAALAAGANALAAAAIALPWLSPRFGSQAGPVEGLAIMIGGVLLSCALAYGAFRFTRSGLPRLHEQSPAAATVVAAALIWLFPAYLVAAYFGWL